MSGAGRALLAAAGALGLLAAGPAHGQPAGALDVRLAADPEAPGAPGTARVRLSEPAHVAVFEIRPGHGAVMRWPSEGASGRLSAGRHDLPLGEGRFGFPDDRTLPLPGFPDHRRVGHLFRPHLLVVASRRPLWLSNHRHGRLFQPRRVFPSVGTMVNALLRDVLPHPHRVRWSFDLVPSLPLRRGFRPLPHRRRHPPPR